MREEKIEGYPNYTITENGIIKGLKGELKPFVNYNGYLKVTLYNEKKKKNFYVHRLVAEYFVPNNLNLPQVDHKDENKQNNHYTNLRWSTRLDNMRHSLKGKLRKPTLTSGQKENIEILKRYGFSITSIAKELNINGCTVRRHLRFS